MSFFQWNLHAPQMLLVGFLMLNTLFIVTIVLNATIMRRARRNPAEYFKTSHSRIKKGDMNDTPEQTTVSAFFVVSNFSEKKTALGQDSVPSRTASAVRKKPFPQFNFLHRNQLAHHSKWQKQLTQLQIQNLLMLQDLGHRNK
jgi:hypothetical protein